MYATGGSEGASALAVAPVSNGHEQELILGLPECDGAGGRVGVFLDPSDPVLLQERSQEADADLP